MRRSLSVGALMAGFLGLAPPEHVQVGQVAPPVVALTIGGNFDIASHYRGKYALLTFWSLKDAASLRRFEQLKKIRQGMATEDRFVIVDVCTDDGEIDQ